MIDKLRRFNRAIDLVNEKLARGVSYLCLFLMVLVVYEVVSRYAFNSPTIWSMEVNQFIFCYLIALGGAYTLRTGGHISVDILFNRFGLRTKAVISTVTMLIVIAFLSITIWKTGVMAADALIGQQHTGTSFNPVTFPVKLIIPIGAFFFLLQSIASLIRYIIKAMTGREEAEEAEERASIVEVHS